MVAVVALAIASVSARWFAFRGTIHAVRFLSTGGALVFPVLQFHRFDRLNVRLRLNAFSAGGTDTDAIISDIHYISATFGRFRVIRRINIHRNLPCFCLNHRTLVLP